MLRPAGDSRPAIPAPAVKRLCLYLRELEALVEAGGETVSSKQLGQALGITDAQVRKDLAHFGQFGHPGVGYDVDGLIAQLRKAIGTDRGWNACLVGVGNLGRALLAHGGFGRKGFRIVAAFDSNLALHGKSVHDRIVQPMRELPATVKRLDIRLGVMAVPAEAAQDVADALVNAGVQGILNFAPKRLTVPDWVTVNGVDLAVELEQLALQLSLLGRSRGSRRVGS